MYIFYLIHAVFSTMTLDDPVPLEITMSSMSGRSFESSMEVNGIGYSTICDCEAPALTKPEEVKCAPTKISLTQDIENSGASLSDVQHKLSSTDFTFVNVMGSSFRCIDGRITSESLCALGGDLGEFALALLVYEDLSSKRLSEDAVYLFLKEYLESMHQDKFYWCTDDIANTDIMQKLGIQGVDFENPREDLKEDLLGLLIMPEGVGDLHLKNLLSRPEEYSVRPEVVQLLIKAFYRLLWQKDDPDSQLLYLETLPGDHNETGFLEVKISEECDVLQVAPLIKPREGNFYQMSLFVHHIEAVSVKRSQIALFFAEKVAKMQDGINTERFLSSMNHHGLMFLDVTGKQIAGDLPFFTANFGN